jgi:wyosine [tRNA(Phe)-imidazoG37] synthetase (radical SAM superfamily)
MQKTSMPGAAPDSGTAFGRPRSFLNNRFVYLVLSQRARGLSIGVNLNPDQRCSFNCVYCEVSRTRKEPERFVDIETMSAELKSLLRRVQTGKAGELPGFHNLPAELLQLKEVALSGDGEPTLCPNFRAVVEAVVRLRCGRKLPCFKIVLITNTTGLDLPEVQRGLELLAGLDEIWVKLDAGTQAYMNKINRPDVKLRKVMGNILLVARERPVVVQSLFASIDGEDPPQREITQYVHRLQELKAAGAQISLVQVYSAHRPPDRPGCGHLPLKRLYDIARRVREDAGLKAEVF